MNFPGLNLWIMAVVILALIGLVTKLITDRIEDTHDITLIEYAAVMVIFTLIIAPLSVHVGWNIAKGDRLNNQRVISGSELSAFTETIACSLDGPCIHTYDCDPYIVLVSVAYSCGNNQTCHMLVPKTKYHSCPYTSKEENYGITGIIDGNQKISYYLGKNRFPGALSDYRWNSPKDNTEPEYSNPIPQNVQNEAGVGSPQEWTDAKARIASGDSGAMSSTVSYQNPLVASQSSKMNLNYGHVPDFEKKNLLPNPGVVINDQYRTNRAQVVGHPINLDSWNQTLEHFNASCDTELKCDLRVVIVNDPYANQNRQSFDASLLAYWLDSVKWGGSVMSPSSILLVLHTVNGETIDSAYANTGVPMYNGTMDEAIEGSLKGKPLDAIQVLGQIHAKVSGESISYEHDNPGIVENIVFGLTNSKTKFQYVDVGSEFSYLIPFVQPTKAQQIWIVIITILIGCIGWYVAYEYGERDN